MDCNKLVSVCINAYNSGKYIAQLLKSICDQSYKNLQIIVVDDASTDNTAEIVKNFGDPRIELYILEKNGHISNANNEAYRKVRGEYMVHIDADDVMCPGLIEKSIDYLERNPECGATFCRLAVIDQDGNDTVNENIENAFKVTARTQADFVRLFFDSLNHLSHSGVTMRKSVIDDIGFHDLSTCYLHDFDYWTRLVLKYPIYVFDECLAKYRMNTTGEHNSCLDESKMIAHNTEFARIIYRMIKNCPDDIFTEAFADRFILKGEHTHEEINLEKAFLLQDGLGAVNMRDNKILSILMLSQLFKDKKCVELARDKFDFTIRDFYKLQTTEAFYDKANTDALKTTIAVLRDENGVFRQNVSRLSADVCNLNQLVSVLQASISEMSAKINETEAELGNYANLAHNRQIEIDRLNNILQHKQKLLNRTVEYRVGKIFKKVFNALRHIKHFLCLRDESGKKYRKSVMLYGYYRMNFGDDLFFEELLSRYPDTVFSVYFFEEYRAFFERFDNVKFYSVTDPFVQKIDKLGRKLGISDFFERLLLMRSNATVHIGGSIYQQVGDYKLDYKLRRRRRRRPFKPFYSISCNFGAHQTEEFKNIWRKQFVKFKDICFRDKYSYSLFSNLKSVRYAPDVLFSYKAPQNIETVSGSVAISVLDFGAGRGIDSDTAKAYLDALVKTVSDFVSQGKKVSLLGFCSYECDADFIKKLLGCLSGEVRDKVEVINYDFGTKDRIINALSEAEFVIGTRLHSIILGCVLGKKVLPIVYNAKIQHILDDIEYDQPVITTENLNQYKEKGFAELLETVETFGVEEYKNSADCQFKMLDKFLK